MDDKNFSELAEKLKKQRITPLQKYQDTVNEYLIKRLADYDIPDCVNMEIAQFMANQTLIFANEQLHDLQREYVKEMKKSVRRPMRQNET